MLHSFTVVAPVSLEPEDFRKTLAALSKVGWEPAGLSAEFDFARRAGLSEGDVIASPLREVDDNFRIAAGGNSGDVFFRDKDIYYAINRADTGRYIAAGISNVEVRDSRPYFQLGLVTDDNDSGPAKLDEFTKAVEDGIRAAVDGRKTRHMDLSWTTRAVSTGRLDGLVKRFTAEGGDEAIRFQSPEGLIDLAEAAELLARPETRELLQELSKAVFARDRDVVSNRGTKGEELRSTLEDLIAARLVDTQFLLECRSSGTRLTRLASPEDLRTPGVGALPCPSCTRSFSDELLSPGYSVSELGKRAIQSSHWMTVWVTQRLLELGISGESILWNLEEASEEVDLVLDFLGELWIFELKDREFGAGDAHALNYRRVRYQADKTVVVTTDHVSQDAKRVFDDLAQEAGERRQSRAIRLNRPTSVIPVYVQGLSDFATDVGAELSSSALRQASRNLALVAQVTGFDLPRVLAARSGSG